MKNPNVAGEETILTFPQKQIIFLLHSFLLFLLQIFFVLGWVTTFDGWGRQAWIGE